MCVHGSMQEMIVVNVREKFSFCNANIKCKSFEERKFVVTVGQVEKWQWHVNAWMCLYVYKSHTSRRICLYKWLSIAIAELKFINKQTKKMHFA